MPDGLGAVKGGWGRIRQGNDCHVVPEARLASCICDRETQPTSDLIANPIHLFKPDPVTDPVNTEYPSNVRRSKRAGQSPAPSCFFDGWL